MSLDNFLSDSGERLCDPEFAAAYFLGVAASGDRIELNQAVQNILRAGAAQMYFCVELTKLRASPHPAEQPGSWNTCRPGDITNPTSLPVDYTLTGIFLLAPPCVGGRCRVAFSWRTPPNPPRCGRTGTRAAPPRGGPAR